MTHFFFHVHNGISVFDEVGLELPDIEAAEAAAIELSGQILNDGPEGPLWQNNTWRVEVSDSPGDPRADFPDRSVFDHARSDQSYRGSRLKFWIKVATRDP